MQLDFLSVSSVEFMADPGGVIVSRASLGDWFKKKRWFMDKEAKILAIVIEDVFTMEVGENFSIYGFMILFHLRKRNNSGVEIATKKYYIPTIISTEPVGGVAEADVLETHLLDGVIYISLAEHSSEFQQAFIHSLQLQKSITTRRGNMVSFALCGEGLRGMDMSTLIANTLNVSTSNVLTEVTADRGSFIAKTYKDMRGDAGVAGKQWPPNMEIQRYEALTAAGYTNMPQLQGISYYSDRATGSSAPLMLMMKKIDNVDEVGGIFWSGLTQLVDGAEELDAHKRSLNLKVTRHVSKLLAATVAEFHHAFLQSDRPGFESIPATDDDIVGWSNVTVYRYEQALQSLEARASQVSRTTVLQDLVKRLKWLAPFNLFQRLIRLSGCLGKAQVHGDLNSSQGLIASSGEKNRVSLLFDHVAMGNEKGALLIAEELVKQVYWTDFEGEPAKDLVNNGYDSRQSLLVDVASVIQGFWYIANIKLYEYLGLNPQENPAHKELARKTSLVLSGQINTEEAGVEQLTTEIVKAINEWLSDVSDSFIEGYLDTAEEKGIEKAILSDWNRDLALTIIHYWIVFRAFHELRYETYARDIGWEGIPTGRILQLTPNIDFPNNGKV